MRLCFLVEEHYGADGMPLDVARRLSAWGHHVDVLRPGGSLLDLSALADTVRSGVHDAWVLKTVSGGPGLSLLEAASVGGLTTVNDVRSIRLVRDKAVAAMVARQHGLPMPPTYAAALPELLHAVPETLYPLVVKPADGSAGRAVRLVASPARLAALREELVEDGLLLAQPYVPNSGVDLKVYCVDGEFHATERCSLLHPDRAVPERRVPLSAEVAGLAARVGEVFGLDLYGLDVLLGPQGPVVVDVNDFPSFRQVPEAVSRVARAVLDLAHRGPAGWACSVSGLRPAAGRVEARPAVGVSAAGRPGAPGAPAVAARGAGLGGPIEGS